MSSTRYYETCWFGRVPVLVGDGMLMGYDYYDTSFAFYLPDGLTAEHYAREFRRIFATPRDELVERGRLARKYFDDVVRRYFADPTLFFLEYLERHGLRG